MSIVENVEDVDYLCRTFMDMVDAFCIWGGVVCAVWSW